MSFLSTLFRSSQGKSNLHSLFLAGVLGQALALAVGLWVEQRLLNAATNWSNSQSPPPSNPTKRPRNFTPSLIPLPPGGRPVPMVEAKPPVISALVTVKLIAFVWICSSQVLVAFLIVSRWNAVREQQRIADANAFAKQNHDLVRTRDAVIFGLAKLAESRDPETGHHLERIALYSTRLAEAMRRHPHFAAEITPTFLKLLGISSALHDIGKVGVEDAVLLKPGRLTVAERHKIQQHTLLGGDCIEQIESRLGASNFLEMAREIALYHHERWNGTGYPHGLAGEKIPLAARIIAVADVYDALSVRRVYKEPIRHEECVQIIREGAGTQFDPQIVDVFLEIESDFEKWAEELSDFFAAVKVSEAVTSRAARTPIMTPEQEGLLAQIIADEEHAGSDPELTMAGAANPSSFAEIP